jgi:hypothetical protein
MFAVSFRFSLSVCDFENSKERYIVFTQTTALHDSGQFIYIPLSEVTTIRCLVFAMPSRQVPRLRHEARSTKSG